MSNLNYDPACKSCQRINAATLAMVQGLVGIAAGQFAAHWTGALTLWLLAQPIIITSLWLTRRIQPMTHHMLISETGDAPQL